MEDIDPFRTWVRFGGSRCARVAALTVAKLMDLSVDVVVAVWGQHLAQKRVDGSITARHHRDERERFLTDAQCGPMSQGDVAAPSVMAAIFTSTG